MKMLKLVTATILLYFGSPGVLAAQVPQPEDSVLFRHYRVGEKLTYQMIGINEAWHYGIQGDGVVGKDSEGRYFEEYRWSNLSSDNQKVVLSSKTADFRQQLSLDPARNPTMPDLSQIDPRLIGPVTDLMTFYADLWLAVKSGQLAHAGDHFYFKRSIPNSWADGTSVVIGEDVVDFDLTLKQVNLADKTALLVVRHVPPAKPEIKLTADWMRKPVADTENNWVQVQKTADGGYLASVGQETFTVELKLADGKILSGSIDNPVETIERKCADAALTRCSDPTPHAIKRRIEISLVGGK